MARTELPRVSVVVPCHDYEQFLDQALASALGQEGIDLDLTVVDDASTDASLAIACEWEERDPRVRVIAHRTNQGHIATFNHALASATAPYVVKLDPDDLLTPGSLRRSAEALRDDPRLAFVYGGSRCFRGQPPRLPREGVRQGVRRTETWTGQEWIWRRAHGGFNVIRQPEIMIRRSALEQVGGHSPSVPEASDYPLWLRLATVGHVARIGGVLQGLYRLHPGSMQHTIHAGVVSDVRARATAFDLFLAERGRLVERPDELRRCVRRTLSREAVRHALDAFDSGRAASWPVEELMALALTLDEEVARSRPWRELERRRAAGDAVPTPRAAPGRLLREARWNHRLQWARRYQR